MLLFLFPPSQNPSCAKRFYYRVCINLSFHTPSSQLLHLQLSNSFALANKMKRILLALFFLAPNLGWAGPYEDGLAAYMRSDYSAALALFRPLAVEGNAEAQKYTSLRQMFGFCKI